MTYSHFDDLHLDMETVRIIRAADFLALYPERGKIIPLPDSGQSLYSIRSCLCFGMPYQSIFPIMRDGSLPYMIEEAYNDDLIDGIIAPSLRECLHYPMERVGDVAPLFPLWSAVNIAHWTFQTMPSLLNLLKQNFEGPFIINNNNNAFSRSFFEILDIPANRILLNDKIYVTDNLWLVGEKKLTESTSDPALFFSVRNALLDRLGTLPGGKRCYIQRPAHCRRKPANEDDVLALLHDYDFEVFVPDFHSVRDQLLALSNSRFTLMPHGGAAALVAMQPMDSAFVEIFNPLHAPYCFIPLASHLRLAYAPFCANDKNDTRDPHADYEVDCRSLRHIIESIIRQSGRGAAP